MKNRKKVLCVLFLVLEAVMLVPVMAALICNLKKGTFPNSVFGILAFMMLAATPCATYLVSLKKTEAADEKTGGKQ